MTDTLTLTPEELIDLTGWRQPSRQIEWLTRAGVPHFVRRDGRPRVVRAALLQSKAEESNRRPRLRL